MHNTRGKFNVYFLRLRNQSIICCKNAHSGSVWKSVVNSKNESLIAQRDPLTKWAISFDFLHSTRADFLLPALFCRLCDFSRSFAPRSLSFSSDSIGASERKMLSIAFLRLVCVTDATWTAGWLYAPSCARHPVDIPRGTDIRCTTATNVFRHSKTQSAYIGGYFHNGKEKRYNTHFKRLCHKSVFETCVTTMKKKVSNTLPTSKNLFF